MDKIDQAPEDKSILEAWAYYIYWRACRLQKNSCIRISISNTFIFYSFNDWASEAQVQSIYLFLTFILRKYFVLELLNLNHYWVENKGLNNDILVFLRFLFLIIQVFWIYSRSILRKRISSRVWAMLSLAKVAKLFPHSLQPCWHKRKIWRSWSNISKGWID